MKYICDFDNEIYDEDEVYDVIAENMETHDLIDALEEVSLHYLFNHLDEEAKELVYDIAYRRMFRDNFTEVEEEDEDDE